MIVHSLAIPGLLLLEPTIHADDRGYFFEPFNAETFKKFTGLKTKFVQDNESGSRKNVLRGLHFQIPPFAQAKLVRVSHGSVLDVAVDIREGSPTFGQHLAVLLSAENKLQFYIPEGFAHGFVALEDNTVFNYKCSNHYSAEHERSLLWNDPMLGIEWHADNPLVSAKDAKALSFASFVSPFVFSTEE
ncbi:MAG: hypothetical protein RL226_1378 [Bacteroidota bacterium]|jgi:dTDP-4-dehydrorhamnose 3,5-epimerase